MRDSVLFYMLSHRSKYFLRFYSVVLFLIVPFVIRFGLEILDPGERFVTTPGMFHVLGTVAILSALTLLLGLYVTMDLKRDVFWLRIDDVVIARAFYVLSATALGLAAAAAGYSLNFAYLCLMMFFVLRDFHLKQAKRYLALSLPLAIFCTAWAEPAWSWEVVPASISNWLTQWLMTASVYCAFDCLSTYRSRPLDDQCFQTNY